MVPFHNLYVALSPSRRNTTCLNGSLLMECIHLQLCGQRDSNRLPFRKMPSRHSFHPAALSFILLLFFPTNLAHNLVLEESCRRLANKVAVHHYQQGQSHPVNMFSLQLLLAAAVQTFEECVQSERTAPSWSRTFNRAVKKDASLIAPPAAMFPFVIWNSVNTNKKIDIMFFSSN